MDLLHLRLHELLALQQALVTRNLHLVPAAARRYSQFGVPWEDLIQEGNAALLRAVERYDWREGVRFAHYATWWIQQGILKALSCQARTVRLPVYLAQLLHRVRAVQAGSAHPLAAEEIARRTRVRVARVERALAADRPCLSLDRSLASAGGEEDTDASLAERIADARPEPEPGAPGAEDLRRTLEGLLDRLPSREARILRLRFGLDGERPHTLEEVRAELGVSRERVRQLQAQSLRRLSQAAPRRELARFL
jgi:RNA polymerase sigma factor (sigma-70 family)